MRLLGHATIQRSSSRPRLLRLAIPIVGSIALALLSGCRIRALTPAGPAARSIAGLWWFMFAISIIVFLAVVITLAIALWRSRGNEEDEVRAHRLSYGMITWGGAIVPGIIVLALMAYNTSVTVRLETPPPDNVLEVAVRAHHFWWEVNYHQYGFMTANEIHVPTGQPFVVLLDSEDVIHSFWVPQLHGKRDLMPDFTGRLWMQADEPGIYRGQCAEFCGLQHAKMHFLVVALEPNDFQAWLQQQLTEPSIPTSGRALRGRQVFMGSECVYCHAISGTNATSTFGPDLTNIASRMELGAGTLPNTRGNLAAWIIDAQHFKPGNYMPPMPVAGPDLQDMLHYMDTLR
jgi:cytochrome c oxidase subunit II